MKNLLFQNRQFLLYCVVQYNLNRRVSFRKTN